MTTPTHYDLKHQNSDRHFFYPHIIHIRCCISVRCTTGCHLTATFNNKLMIMITNPGNVSHLFLYRGSLSKMGILGSAKYLEILGHSAFGQLMNPDHHLLEAPATTALNVTRVLPSSPPSPGHRPRLERAPAATTPTSSFPTPTSPLLPRGSWFPSCSGHRPGCHVSLDASGSSNLRDLSPGSAPPPYRFI